MAYTARLGPSGLLFLLLCASPGTTAALGGDGQREPPLAASSAEGRRLTETDTRGRKKSAGHRHGLRAHGGGSNATAPHQSNQTRGRKRSAGHWFGLREHWGGSNASARHYSNHTSFSSSAAAGVRAALRLASVSFGATPPPIVAQAALSSLRRVASKKKTGNATRVVGPRRRHPHHEENGAAAPAKL